MVLAWSYFLWTGSISTIWPMFGIANQLLAAVALAIGTTILINLGRGRYAWVTLLPLSFLSVTTLTAGFLSVRDNFWPLAIGPDPARHFQGYLDATSDGDHDGLRRGDSRVGRSAVDAGDDRSRPPDDDLVAGLRPGPRRPPLKSSSPRPEKQTDA